MSDYLFDTQTSFEGGTQGGFDPSLITDTQIATGVNVSCRNGTMKSRPAILDAPLTFESVEAREAYEWGKFQGCEDYNSGTSSYVATSISGHLFLINISNFNVTWLTEDGTFRMNEYNDRLWFCQVERMMVIQDGSNAAKIISGVTIRNADKTLNEVPTGTNMAYGHGRLFLAVSSRHFISGDINKIYEPEAVLKFTELAYLNEGGGWTVNSKMGNIVGMTFSNKADSSTGDGPLLVMCENGFTTYAVNNARSTWSNNSIVKIQLIGTGILGSDGFTNINEDILYRADEGIRSYGVARAENTSAFKFTELSREVEDYIKADTPFSSRFISMGFFDKRMLMTTNSVLIKAKDSIGRPVDDFAFKGVIAFDFSLSGYQKPNPAATYTRKTTGAYDGVWTGLYVTKLITAQLDRNKRCFAMTKTPDGRNGMAEIGKRITGYDHNQFPIESKVITRAMPFKQPETYIPTPFILKKFTGATFWLSDIRDDVDIDVFIKSDRASRFNKIGTMSFRAKTSQFEVTDGEIEIGDAQSRSMIKIKMPEFSSDSITKIPNLVGNKFQFMIKWRGSMTLKEMLFEALKIDDQDVPTRDTKKIVHPFDTYTDYTYVVGLEEQELK